MKFSSAVLAGTLAISPMPSISGQNPNLPVEDPRICLQNFGGNLMDVACENIKSILDSLPGHEVDATKDIKNIGQLNVIRDKTGKIVLVILTPDSGRK